MFWGSHVKAATPLRQKIGPFRAIISTIDIGRVVNEQGVVSDGLGGGGTGALRFIMASALSTVTVQHGCQAWIAASAFSATPIATHSNLPTIMSYKVI